MNKTNIYIIRHGETVLNVQGRLQGHVDIPLNENGKKLAAITGEALKDIPFDIVFTSPLCRALDTARLATAPSSSQFHREIPVIEDPRLMEINWGQWDQLSCLENKFEIPCDDFNLFYTDPFQFKPAPEGESILQVCERTGAFWTELIHNPAYQGKNILLSAHGCSVRGLFYQICKDASNFWRDGVPPNCSVSLVEVEAQNTSIVFEDRIYYDPTLSVNPYKVLA